MWPFKRKVEAPADGPHPVPAPVIRRDWVGLPPIQRFIGAHPLTAPSDQFSDDLATHQDPSVTTDTMGHQVSAEAPAGLVLALARPTTRSDGPAMIPRPRVQRSVAGAVAESGEWDGDEAASVTRPTPLPMSAHTVAARELSVVAPEPMMQRLTTLPPDAEPTPLPPVAQRSRSVPAPLTMSSLSDEPSDTPPAPVQRLTLGQSRRMGLGAPIKRVPDRSVQRAVTELPLPPVSQTEKVDASPVAREPIDASPVGPIPDRSVQRAAMEFPLPTLPHTGREPMVASTGTRESMDVSLAPSLDASDEPRLDLRLARRPVAEESSAGDRQLSAPAPSVQLSADTTPTLTPRSVREDTPHPDLSPQGGRELPFLTPADALTAPSPGVSTSRLPLVTESPARASTYSALSAPAMAAMAPLVGTRPLRPSATLQRSASANAATMTIPQMKGEDAPSLTLRQRGREDTALAEGDRTDAPSLTFLQRDSEDTLHADPSPQGGREFSAPLTLPQRGRADDRLPLAPSRGIAVQASSDDTPHPDPPPQGGREILQGVWYEAPVGVSRVSAGAAPLESSTPVAAPAGPAQASETEMDELARKLYDRIRTRLKTELLVDRERAGFLTDLR